MLVRFNGRYLKLEYVHREENKFRPDIYEYILRKEKEKINYMLVKL